MSAQSAHIHVIATQHLDVAYLWRRHPDGEELMRQCFEKAVEMLEIPLSDGAGCRQVSGHVVEVALGPFEVKTLLLRHPRQEASLRANAPLPTQEVSER